MSLAPMPDSASCDLLVIGSGAGGLSAAVTAAKLGLRVIVAEKEACFGGTTAWSGGWMWIPRNPLAVAAGIVEDIDAPMTYLRKELGTRFDEPLARAFIENGPRMVEFFRSRTAVQFIDGNAVPDFHGKTEGAALGGRSVCAAPFDGRRLGDRIAQLKPPLKETTLWGLGIGSGDLKHFFEAMRSPESLRYVAGLVVRHWRDLLVHKRSMRLVNGNALVASLMRSALDAGVELRSELRAVRLVRRDGKIRAAVFKTPSGELEIHATRGVVLACGGFPHDEARKKTLLPHAPTGCEHWSAAPAGNTGDGLSLGEAVGGVVASDLAQAAALAPVSLVPRADGSTAHFPHLLERGKPGLIAVNSAGLRFTNEADPYHDFVKGLLANVPAGQPAKAWLVCDHHFLRHYGLGAVKPAPMPMSRALRNGYLKKGHSLEELARRCGIAPGALSSTVERYNLQAAEGRDVDFAKGETPYNRRQGDVTAGGPNPCMAPLEHAPFYAVEIVPGSLGTFAGLRTNSSAQVLDAAGLPIAGLYAAGNDMSSVMGGHYPSGGITLGPAMTFGFIAAHDAARRAQVRPVEPADSAQAMG